MEESKVGAFSLQEANAVLEFWREFDLDGRRLTLDKSCIEMREMKTSSINGRKHLNDLTKSFRNKSKEEQLGQLNEVLKAYQDEIDQLSRRSKLSETAFYSLYKGIYEAPDPTFTITALVEMINSSSTHMLEIERLRSELSQYEEEFQALKNQDITIRRLEDQILEYKEQIEDKVLEEVNQRLAEIEEQAERKITAALDAQKIVEKRLSAAIESMKQAQQATERAQNELYETASQSEVRASALLAENALLAEGSDRARDRIQELENEVEVLRRASLRGNDIGLTKLTAPSSPSSSVGADTTSDVDVETLQLVVADLRQELRKREEVTRADKQRYELTVRESATQLMEERQELTRLRQELAQRPRKEDLQATRRQLYMLQRIAFSVEDEDDADGVAASEVGVESDDKSRLELMLTRRMKSLESDLAEARQALRDARAVEAAASAEADSLRTSLDSSRALVARLEADLERTTTTADGGRASRDRHVDRNYSDVIMGGKGNMIDEYIARDDGMEYRGSSGVNISRCKDTSTLELSELLGVGDDIKSNSNSNNSNNNIGTTGQQQMISILQAQRDRYKERLSQAEDRELDFQQQAKAAQDAKTQLEADNLALYEKIRYLQSYAHSSHSSSHPSRAGVTKGTPSKGLGGKGHSYPGSGRHPSYSSPSDYSRALKSSLRSGIPGLGLGLGMHGGGVSDDSVGDDEGDIEGRYHALYEQRMNPFTAFSQHERQRKLHELSVADRIVLNTTLAFVSSHIGRTFLVIYLGAMHLLVFATLYYNAHHVHYGCDPNIDTIHAAAIAASITANKL